VHPSRFRDSMERSHEALLETIKLLFGPDAIMA
jgi:hypothetical protein